MKIPQLTLLQAHSYQFAMENYVKKDNFQKVRSHKNVLHREKSEVLRPVDDILAT